MRILVFFIVVISLLFSCRKKDSQAENYPTIDSTALCIVNSTKTDINEFDVRYVVNPAPNETFTNIFLQWSSSADFSTAKDSTAITVTGIQTTLYHLKGLKQSSHYYARISLIYHGKKMFSNQIEMMTDSFKISSVGYYGPERGLNKRDTAIAVTNLQQVLGVSPTTTKIFLGNYECPVVSDQGLIISFNVPLSVPSGKYVFKITSRGMETQLSDSIEVLRGQWSRITSPPIPINPNASTSGLVFFGTCHSSQKGYMLGGLYINGPQVPWPDSQYPEFILEFDGIQHTWTKRYPASPRYFEDPVCYYHNNGIYVVSGYERRIDQWGNDHGVILKKMLRLDLGTLVWTEVCDLPYSTIFNTTSFELNNEWYIGMGADSAAQTNGYFPPSKKFWKYNPSTNQWTQLTDFPGGHQNYPTCFSIGSRGYAFYGDVGDVTDPTVTNEQFWEYNTATNAWSAINLPATGGPPPGEKYQIVVYNGKAYFLSSQKRSFFGLNGYGFLGQMPCLEWEPLTNTYKKISFPYGGDNFRTIFNQGNTFFFQSDALGYFTSVPNRAYSLSIEP